MRESENALWAKTRRRNMAAYRRRTERSENAAEPPAPAARRFPHKRCGKNSAHRARLF